MTRKTFQALALLFGLGAVIGASACEERLEWRCETVNADTCTCFLTQNFVVDPTIVDPATQFCGPDVTPNAICCYIVDADGDPASCTCSPDACNPGYSETKDCKALERFL